MNTKKSKIFSKLAYLSAIAGIILMLAPLYANAVFYWYGLFFMILSIIFILILDKLEQKEEEEVSEDDQIH